MATTLKQARVKNRQSEVGSFVNLQTNCLNKTYFSTALPINKLSSWENYVATCDITVTCTLTCRDTFNGYTFKVALYSGMMPGGTLVAMGSAISAGPSQKLTISGTVTSGKSYVAALDASSNDMAGATNINATANGTYSASISVASYV